MSVVGGGTKRRLTMSDSPITISEESVRKEGAEIEAQAKELAARQDRFLKLADYLRAVGKGSWVPATVILNAQPQRNVGQKGPPPASSGTWTSEMLAALANYPEGVTQAELLIVLRDGPIAERNPNGIYNATSHMEKDGRIKKHNGRLFLPHLYEEYMQRVENGEIADFKGSNAGTIADKLVDIISAGNGLESAEIVEKMKVVGVTPASVYNNLSKIVMKGRVRREGKIYLPLKNEALPDHSESASQITGSEIEPSSPNMSSGTDQG